MPTPVPPLLVLGSRRRDPNAPPGMPSSDATGGRVAVLPSPRGTVAIVGRMQNGTWVAEYRCRAEDFDQRVVLAMEQRVRAMERKELRLVT